MDRRDFVASLLAASTVTATEGTLFAQATPKPPSFAGIPATLTTLPLIAKRYDGRSGNAVFSGTIPLRPGQLRSGQLGNVSLWDGDEDLPISVQDLGPIHPDGSLKVLQVQASVELNSGGLKPLTLRLDEAPASGTVSGITIDEAWMTNPTLLACSDPAHLCASHVALGPLVPITHPGLPSHWVKSLLSEFDTVEKHFPNYGRPIELWKQRVSPSQTSASWPNYAGGATYNALYPMYCRYLITGNIDDLRNAHGIASWSEGWPFTMREQSHTNCITNAESGERFTINFDYPDPPANVAGYPASLSEWNSGNARDLYMCWVMSGWRQARGAGIGWGMRAIQTGQSDASVYGGRFDWRFQREAAIYMRMFNIDEPLRFSLPDVFTVTARASSDSSWWADHFQTHHFDKYEAWASTHDASDYRHGIWGHHSKFNPYGNGTAIPNFQFITVFYTIYFLQMNAHADRSDRTWDQLETLADLMRRQTSGPFGDTWGPTDALYAIRYRESDPANGGPAGLGGDTQYSCSMMTPLFAWAWAKTGDSRFLEVIDRHNTNASWTINNAGSAGTGWKQVGEFFGGLYHAAAWRAGVEHDGWDPD